MHTNQYTTVSKSNEYTVREMLNIGVPKESIMKTLGISKIIVDYLSFKYAKGTSLGHKFEPYATEEEMLNEPKYEYNDLSDDEKHIYRQSGAICY